MSDEERKAKRAAYVVQWRKNLSRFQKEKRRLEMNEYRRKARENWTPEYLEEMRERNRVYYAKNKDILLAKMAIYRENKKQENHDDSKGKRKVD